MRWLTVIGALTAVLAGCGGSIAHPNVPNASASNGKRLIEYYGCGACHVISGITPQARVGPSLVGLANRRQLAGTLPNTTANLVRWIEHPQQIVPMSAMPNLGIGERGATDIAAYLYSH